MRIAVLSDAALPTPYEGGHGLGRIVYQVAEGLRTLGHDVVLFARRGSRFSGRLIAPDDAVGYQGEKALAREAMRIHHEWPFDVFYDNGHLHLLSAILPDLPVVNVYHDIFQPHSRCPVLLSEGQRTLMPPAFYNARVILNALDPAAFTFNENPVGGDYALFLGALSDIKQPLLAIEACARAGVKLVMAGQELVGRMPFSGSENVEFVGPVVGMQRDALLQNARLLLQLGTGESFGLTTLEANLCGTPVVAWPAGGSLDLIKYGINGVFVPITGRDMAGNVADAIERAWDIPRVACRAYAERLSSPARQLEQIEDTLADCVRGARW